jgi:hypothetical protein
MDLPHQANGENTCQTKQIMIIGLILSKVLNSKVRLFRWQALRQYSHDACGVILIDNQSSIEARDNIAPQNCCRAM